MADMTLGQRISTRRRQLRLTQEELGGMLEITGRTVAKWESDIVIPDAGSLQALSQALDVGIGWLLGYEESHGEENGFPIQSPSLSEGQLEQVEALIRRYSEQFPARGRSVGSRLALLLAVLALIAALASLAHTRSRLDAFTRELNSLSGANAALQQQLTELSGQLDAWKEAAQGTRLLSDYQISARANPDSTGAVITFEGTPARTQPGDQVFLDVRLEGREVASVLCQSSGTTCSASLELPAADGYRYQVRILHPDGSTESQSLTDSACIDPFAQDISRGLNPTLRAALQWEQKVFALCFKGCDLELIPPGLISQSAWIDGDLVLLKNDNRIQQISLRKYIRYLAGSNDSNRLAGTVYPEIEPVTMEAGDLLEIRLIAVLQDGTAVEKTVLRLVCDKPGSITELPISD